jgi:cytoskeletal protein RodZ
MTNIGHQLMEARSRLGYTLKDVSDRIHIRPEFLARIEDNTFEIPLHEVYIRGFVRLYSKFLKLNPDEMVESFNKRSAQIRFTSEVRADRELLGTYTAPVEERVEKVSEPEGDPAASSGGVFDRYRDPEEPEVKPWFQMAVVGLLVIALFAVFFALKLFVFKDRIVVAEDPLPVPSATAAADSSAAASLDRNLIGLIAKDPVYLFVTQTADHEILYSGRLNPGERKTLIRSGEISIACDRSENLVVERGGVALDLKGMTGKVRFVVD